MKFSRNPITGVLESYSDEAIFAGPVLTMADLISSENRKKSRKWTFVEDGGPGSGNFGHSGRPGKVGGSAPEDGSSRKMSSESSPKTVNESHFEWYYKPGVKERLPKVGMQMLRSLGEGYSVPRPENAAEMAEKWQEVLNKIKKNELSSGRLESADIVLEVFADEHGIKWPAIVDTAREKGETLPNLSKEETEELLNILSKYSNFGTSARHQESQLMDFTKNQEERNKYFLLKAKSIMGTEPESDEVIEEKERKKQEEIAKRKSDFFDDEKVSERESEYAKLAEKGDIEGIQKLALSTGAFEKGASVSLSQCNPHCAQVAVAKTEEFVRAFPFMYGNMASIEDCEHGRGVYASCEREQGRMVRLNAGVNYFGGRSTVKLSYEQEVKTGYHPEGTNWESVIIHEQAHALGGFLSKKYILGGQLSSNERQSFEYKLRERVMKKLNLTEADVQKELSKYATKDSYEWFAEAIAEALDSPNPRRMAAEAKRQLDEVLREAGLLNG